ncbi:hypothetical protein VZT92_012094 [Zoarces viviparus]|uniref:Uncharacterized protein n=1 Tax=Zoarces viviparus TaxID=48416 RepID=A0AAW1F7Q0_ZOAVI
MGHSSGACWDVSVRSCVHSEVFLAASRGHKQSPQLGESKLLYRSPQHRCAPGRPSISPQTPSQTIQTQMNKVEGLRSGT